MSTTPEITPQAPEAVEALIRRLSTLPLEKAEEVLSELDPKFVREVLSLMVGRLPPEAKKKLLVAARRMEKERTPKDAETLWKFVRDECGLKIPRKGVCEGHCGPFDFMVDSYFGKGSRDKLAVGNRGSGKTQIMGALHAVNARTKPRYTAATVGATEAQSMRCYGFFRDLITQSRWLSIISGRITMGRTEFEHGGAVEIVTGTISGVNSPHPVLAHFDEVELLRPGVYDEALNMAQSKYGFPAMNILTSSWKKPKGFVSKLIDECTEAERENAQPPYQVYRWCVWETTEPCIEDCSACPFANVKKGEWEDGSPRSFESACKRGSPVPGTGKLKFTDGFVSVEDAVARFRKLPRRVWESQQESKRPTLEGLVYDLFDEDLHTVEYWDPLPELGAIYVGLDFGGTAPHAAGFWQELRVPVTYKNRELPVGATVRFDEVHIKDVGNAEFGRRVNERVQMWSIERPGFKVESFFGDPAARAAREEFRALSKLGAGVDIHVRYRGHVDVENRIALVYERMANDLIYIDRARCPEFMEEIGGYDRNANTGRPIKEDDHHMDEMGYVHWNIHVDRRRGNPKTYPPTALPRPRAAIRTQEGHRWDPGALGDPGSVDSPIRYAARKRRDPF